MIYIFFVITFLFVVVFKTTIAVQMKLFYGCYDLFLLVVIYFGFYRSVRESLPFIFFFGIIMDALSGGPFGLFTTTYFWLYIFTIWLTRFIRVTNSMILPGVVFLSVIIQNTIFLGSMALLDPNAAIPSFSFKFVLLQIAWGVVTGPILIIGFRDVGHKLEKLQRSFQSDLG